MEEITDAVSNINIAGDTQKKNRIQVSNTKMPLFFYVNLSKRYMQQHNDVELSALGMAISTVVSVPEILKNNGFAVEKKITTSTVEIRDESRGRPISKAKEEEEEEDGYDDVAVGTEQHAGDCLYMKDVKIVEYDDIEELDTHCELLNSLRSNPIADKEDAEAYANCDTSLISGNVDAGDYNGEELDVKHPKPILKKGGKLTEKTSKRVRFLCEPEDENVDQHSSDSTDFNFMLFRGLFNE